MRMPHRQRHILAQQQVGGARSVLAVAPFNSTAIGGNLATAPLLFGNTVVYKPAHMAALAAHIVHDILIEAGLPAGVIHLIFAPNEVMTEVALVHHDLAGIHFTGSTATFQPM